MKLEKSIILHATEEAKKKWEQRDKTIKRNNSCPSCEIEDIKRFVMKNGEVTVEDN
jgi:uncharacterized protein (DUF1919 family)